MELVVAILSLMWVIGILSLQRIDTITDEFGRGLGYYLSIHNNAIDQTQLNVLTVMPVTGIIAFTRLMAVQENRPDRQVLKRGIGFFEIAQKCRRLLVFVLAATTAALPFFWIQSFSNTPFTFLDKDAALYLALVFVVAGALGTEKLISYLSDKRYPLKVEVAESSHSPQRSNAPRQQQ